MGWDPEMVRICGPRPRGAARARAPTPISGSADSEWSRQELESLGLRAHGGAAHLPRLRRYREAPNPVLRAAARGRPHQPAVRGPPRAEQVPGGPDPPGVATGSASSRPTCACCSWASCPRRRGYFDALQSFAYEEGFTPAEVVFTGPRRSRRPPRVLRGRSPLRLHERARGLRRAPRGVDAHARAGPRLLRDRGAPHPRLRGRAASRRRARWPRWARWPTSSRGRGPLREAVLAGTGPAPRRLRAGGGRGGPARLPGVAVSAAPDRVRRPALRRGRDRRLRVAGARGGGAAGPSLTKSWSSPPARATT